MVGIDVGIGVYLVSAMSGRKLKWRRSHHIIMSTYIKMHVVYTCCVYATPHAAPAPRTSDQEDVITCHDM